VTPTFQVRVTHVERKEARTAQELWDLVRTERESSVTVFLPYRGDARLTFHERLQYSGRHPDEAEKGQRGRIIELFDCVLLTGVNPRAFIWHPVTSPRKLEEYMLQEHL